MSPEVVLFPRQPMSLRAESLRLDLNSFEHAQVFDFINRSVTLDLQAEYLIHQQGLFLLWYYSCKIFMHL